MLIVDRAREQALVTFHGPRWLLPVACVPERTRSGPLVLRWMAERDLCGQVIGQWLGRGTCSSDVIDWLVVAQTSAHRSVPDLPDLRWAPLRSLVSGVSLFDYQQWAVGETMATGYEPTIPGPFGTSTWPDDALAWTREIISPIGLGPLDEVVPYRTTAYDVALRMVTACGPLFFKGVSSDRADEVMRLVRMSERYPDCFPQTRALRRLTDGTIWWLMEPCPGTPATEHLTPAVMAGVAAAYAHVQQRVRDDPVHGRLLEIPDLDLEQMVVWAEALFADACSPLQAGRCSDAIHEASQRMSKVDATHGWIATDLDPSNVLLHDREVRFIDLAESRWGPAPIAAATLARRSARFGVPSAEIYRAYEAAWTSPLNIGTDWHSFELVSCLVECYLSWTRVVVKDRRGETSGLLQASRARLAKRLANAALRESDT